MGFIHRNKRFASKGEEQRKLQANITRAARAANPDVKLLAHRNVFGHIVKLVDRVLADHYSPMLPDALADLDREIASDSAASRDLRLFLGADLT